MGCQDVLEGCEVCVAFLESEGAEGQAESNVVECVEFGSGGGLGGGYRDFDLLSHVVVTIVDTLGTTSSVYRIKCREV